MNTSNKQNDSLSAAAEKSAPDFRVENTGQHSSLFLVRPLNTAAQKHLTDNVQEDAQWLGTALAVEFRYVLDLVDALRAEGFTVE